VNTPTLRDWRAWLGASPGDLLDRFASLPGSQDGGSWVYVPGLRPVESRALLVAHVDTVRDKPPQPGRIRRKRGVLSVPGEVLGGDDRAGCAMLWTLRGLGHSILATDFEEVGGLGAEDAARSLGAEVLGAHVFAVQWDRRGRREGVFYPGTYSQDFSAFLAGALPDWGQGWGSYTDIATLCPVAGVCGVNLAVGFRNEHTARETLNLRDWADTLRASLSLLDRDTLPRFTPEPEPPRDRRKGLGALWDLDPWAAVPGASWDSPGGWEPAVDRCPVCGLSTVWVDPAHPLTCPDCGEPLPPEVWRI